MKNTMKDVAIIGAGTAGALAANQLNAAGLECCIVEKSRGLGGRCSRRRVLDGMSVDLGTSSFSIPYTEHPILIGNINRWLKSGYLSEWIFNSADFQTQPFSMKSVELCGAPSMNAFHRHLVDGVDCLTQKRVHKLNRVDDYWQLLDESGDVILEANAVIITAPAEQTYNLVSLHDLEHNFILSSSQASLPQYVCAIAFDQPQKQLADVYSGEHPVFSKIIRDNSKPARPYSKNDHTPEVWILHSTHQWAQEQQHREASSAAEDMAKLFCQYFNISSPDSLSESPAKVVTSQYWRLANHEHSTIKSNAEKLNSDNQPFLWNEDINLGCCADWLAGGGIAGALSSSQHLCNHITSQLNKEV